MEIKVSTEQARVPVSVFHISGEIDANSYEQLQIRAQQVVHAGARNIILDLAQVTYISSAGLRAINTTFNLLRANAPEENDAALSKGLRDGTFKSAHLKLLSPQPIVRKALDAVGLDMYVGMYTTLAEALAAF